MGTFFTGDFAPREPGSEWSLFVDERIVRHAFEQRLWNEMVLRDEIVLNDSFITEWTSLGVGGGEVSFYISGTATESVCSIDFVASPVISIFPDGDDLVIEGVGGIIETSSSDEVHCAASVALFYGLWAVGLQDLAGLIIYFVKLNGDEVLDLSSGAISGWDCTSSDGNFSCRNSLSLDPLEVNGETVATMLLSHVRGEDNGLIFGGTFDVPFVEPLNVEGEVTFPMDFDTSECCGGDLLYAGHLHFSNYGEFCEDPRVVNDPEGFYSIERVPYGWRVQLDISRWEEFWADPLPAHVYVLTKGGAATFEIDPGDEPTEENLQIGCAAERELCGGLDINPTPGSDIETRHSAWRDPAQIDYKNPSVDKSSKDISSIKDVSSDVQDTLMETTNNSSKTTLSENTSVARTSSMTKATTKTTTQSTSKANEGNTSKKDDNGSTTREADEEIMNAEIDNMISGI